MQWEEALKTFRAFRVDQVQELTLCRVCKLHRLFCANHFVTSLDNEQGHLVFSAILLCCLHGPRDSNLVSVDDELYLLCLKWR